MEILRLITSTFVMLVTIVRFHRHFSFRRVLVVVSDLAHLLSVSCTIFL